MDEAEALAALRAALVEWDFTIWELEVESWRLQTLIFGGGADALEE